MKFRHTKIICTIGPKTCSYDMLEKLARAGMDVARLNMSHGDHAWHEDVIRHIHKLNRDESLDVSVMVDIMGPQIRTGDLDDPLKLKKGDRLTLAVDYDEKDVNSVWVSYDRFLDDIKIGDTILIDNGLLKLKVFEKNARSVICRCLNKYVLTSRRHVNLPGHKLRLPSLTKKDWSDIHLAQELDVDFLALSFVRSAKDLTLVKSYLHKKKTPIDVIAKIETREAVSDIKNIVNAADGIMIARGDLGAELPFSEVPILQKEIIELCNDANKPVIVATHILESMIEHATPTRAEVTDLSYAVFQRADCVMLSGETAVGAYPVESVKTMAQVVDRIEKELLKEDIVFLHENNTSKEEIVESASVMAVNLKAKAIVVFTHSGNSARLTSRCRSGIPIYAFSREEKVDEKLRIAWGVQAFHYRSPDDPEKKIQTAFDMLRKKKLLRLGDKVIVVSDVVTATKERVGSVQIREI